MVNESTFWVASSVVLLLIVIGLIGYIIAMKRIVRGIKKELPRTRDIDYNKQKLIKEIFSEISKSDESLINAFLRSYGKKNSQKLKMS